MIIVVAEKPSVARAIEKTLRNHNIGKNVYVIGLRSRLLDSDLKEGYEWGKTDPSKIFDLREFQLKIRDNRSYDELVKIFKNNFIEELVIATDNDSEGELIGWEVLQVFKNYNGFGKISKMRFNAVSDEELWRSWQNREEKIRDFKPTPYWVIVGRFRTVRGEVFEARSNKIEDGKIAQELFSKIRNVEEGVVKEYGENVEIVRRPKQLRTDEMLRDLHKITGVSASNILRIAEELYSNGYISYPRTDTNQWLKDTDFRKIKSVAIKGLGLETREILEQPNPFNGSKNDGAHPPLYPVAPYPRDNTLKWRVWEYIARRFLANVYSSNAKLLKQRALIKVGEIMLKTVGGRIEDVGFYKVYPYFKPEENPIPKMTDNEKLKILELRLVKESTKPPKRLSESELLKLMERDGIGTDATRAEYPKIIMERGYAVKNAKVIKPTELRMNLIKSLREVDVRLVSPQTRRIVEEYMDLISRGEKKYSEALDETLKLYHSLYKQLEAKINIIADELAGSKKHV